jgi:hypothetical protein
MVKTTIIVKKWKKDSGSDIRIFFKIKNQKILKSFVIKLSTRACVISSFKNLEYNYDYNKTRKPYSNEIQLLVSGFFKKHI